MPEILNVQHPESTQDFWVINHVLYHLAIEASHVMFVSQYHPAPQLNS
jgi:hypothetical protein